MSKMLRKRPTWAELKQVVRGGWMCIQAYISVWPDEYREAVSLALSVAHWARSERNWIWSDPCPRTGGNYCGLCTHYGMISIEDSCKSCLLPTTAAGTCGADLDRNYWSAVRAAAVLDHNRQAFEHYADLLYNCLVELYQEAWDKL